MKRQFVVLVMALAFAFSAAAHQEEPTTGPPGTLSDMITVNLSTPMLYGPQHKVVESAADAMSIQQQLNRMAQAGWTYHDVIVAPDVSDRPRLFLLFRSTGPVGMAHGVPSVLSYSNPIRTGRYAARETPWIVNAANGHSYRVIASGDWMQSAEAARAQGAHLVTINDAEEQAWLVETFGGSAYYWIGFTDAGDEGAWRWASGEETDYTNWNAMAEEPNNLWDSGEHYAHMNWQVPGEWNDLGPGSPEWLGVRHAIIEKPTSEDVGAADVEVAHTGVVVRIKSDDPARKPFLRVDIVIGFDEAVTEADKAKLTRVSGLEGQAIITNGLMKMEMTAEQIEADQVAVVGRMVESIAEALTNAGFPHPQVVRITSFVVQG